jgi:RNA binding exosome subunit
VIANVRIRAFAYPTEDEALVLGVLERLAPGAEVRRGRAEGGHGVKVMVLEARLEKRKPVDRFFRGLSSGVLGDLASTTAERIDASGHLYFRLDKQELVMGRLRLASGGDVVAVECVVHGPKGARGEIWRTELERLIAAAE